MTQRQKAPKRTAKTQDVADEFSVSARTVHEWVSRGCPCTRGPKGNGFNVGEVAKWKRDNNVTGEPGRPKADDSPDLEAAKLRKENALASKYELQVERERGEVVAREEVKAAWLSLVTTCKNKLLGLAASVAPQLTGLDAAAAQTILEARITEALNGLASN